MFVKNFALQICTVYQRIQILYQILWIKYGEMLNEENLLKILLIDANIEDRKVYLFSNATVVQYQGKEQTGWKYCTNNVETMSSYIPLYSTVIKCNKKVNN